MKQRELSEVTLYSFGAMAMQYLAYLETRGIRTWEAADGASVLGFLEPCVSDGQKRRCGQGWQISVRFLSLRSVLN